MPKRILEGLIGTLAILSSPVLAGPPYFTDDRQPTDESHYEIYLFDGGTRTHDGTGNAAGIDFNYGAAPGLQLTAVMPLDFDRPVGGPAASGLGNIELAAKYRFRHAESTGWDMAFFPRLFLPSGSNAVGERHASLLLPLWIQKTVGPWSTFGGGGCAIHRGGQSRDFCVAGWALTRKIDRLQLGAEIHHETADTRDGPHTTGVGAGFSYDWSERFHLMGSMGPGIQNADATNRYFWYAALLTTF